MKKHQKTIPQRERGSSQKNSLVCRQCGLPVPWIHKSLGIPEANQIAFPTCINCFIKKHHYDPRQKGIDFKIECF